MDTHASRPRRMDGSAGGPRRPKPTDSHQSRRWQAGVPCHFDDDGHHTADLQGLVITRSTATAGADAQRQGTDRTSDGERVAYASTRRIGAASRVGVPLPSRASAPAIADRTLVEKPTGIVNLHRPRAA